MKLLTNCSDDHIVCSVERMAIFVEESEIGFTRRSLLQAVPEAIYLGIAKRGHKLFHAKCSISLGGFAIPAGLARRGSNCGLCRKARC